MNESRSKTLMKPSAHHILAAWFLFVVASSLSAGTREQAKTILVPEFKVEDVTLAKALVRIREVAKQYSTDEKGLNFAYQFTPAGKKYLQTSGFSMEFDNVSVERLVEYFCKSTGLKCRFDEQVIVIGDHIRTSGGALETRVFRVAPGVVDTPRTRPKAEKIDWDD
jgi:hypothetical protein